MAKKEITTENSEKGWKLPPKVYTQNELIEFGKWLELYFIKTATMPNGQVVRGYDWKKIYFDAGAQNEKGEVLVNNYTEKLTVYKDGHSEWHADKCEIPQEELENKIDQWKMFVGRNDWIENKKIEALEEMASQIGKLKSLKVLSTKPIK